MSREGANNRIDSLKNSLNHDHYQRTALGSAARFNVMLHVLDDLSNEEGVKVTRDEFSALMDQSVTSLIDEFDAAIEDDGITPQQALQNRAYKTALGQTVAKATTQRKGLYQDFNTSYSTGATGAFRSFTNGFIQDDEDYFGSRVLYDNVFGNYEDGTESLSSKKRIAMSDPANDNRTVGEKVLENVVNKSIYDQTEIIDRVDIEFGRFHGQSMIDQYSMTGSGLRSARQTIRTVMQEGSAYGRQVAARGESDDHPVTLAQALMDRTGQDIDSTNSALNLLNNNLANRSAVNNPQDGGYVNKAGVAEFIDLINSAGTKDANGALTGGRISISSFQFQNETISAALSDKIQRHVLESVLQKGGAPLQIDLTLAYPRQRNIDSVQNQDGRYAVGQTNYGILGPNLIEAMKLQKVKEDVEDMLRGLGIPADQINNYVNLNIEFRDKKFHPKVYLTDNRASIGTQNLTAPVGTSINQAGSNFETMRFVDNVFKDDNDLRNIRSSFNGQDIIQANSITQSLLYRQIVDSVNQEREYNNGSFTRGQGNTSTPILSNQRGSQVGFAGDIYQHLKNTLDFAHTSSFGNQQNNPMHMFLTLDQAFMLQLGSASYAKQLKGEMGDETSDRPYSAKDRQAREYQKLQNNLFDLLISDRASVVVDTKNYKGQVMDPLLNKIYAKDDKGNYLNTKLISNFEKQGGSFNILAGFELLKGGANSSQSEYDSSLQVMFSELRRLGFNKEAGFEDSDLKQIVGLASGNIQMARAPRQHAKEAALVQYGNNGPELISYYQGSSNMGLYSLGINSGENGEYRKGDGDLTNTEMGIMLGRRDINSNLSRAISSVRMSDDFKSSNNILGQNIELQEWILNQQEEEYELGLAQRHLSVTWNHLSQGTSIEDPTNKRRIGMPGWQENVNTTDLNILKNRLEAMSKDLGLSPSAFSITNRYGNISGQGITSINISIDLNQVLSIGGGFMQASANLPKLNFELSVLQGPSRGEGIFSDSKDDGSAPGFVYFVDKNKLIGNGLFVNESGQNISVLGRRKYEDKFNSDIREGGRINLASGQSAHMSSLDIVPQLFATLIGEGVSRFGVGASINTYENMSANDKQTVLLNYVSNILNGHTGQIDESIASGTNIVSSLSQIKDNLNIISLQELNETINRHSRSLENRSDSNRLQSRDFLEATSNANELSEELKQFNNSWFHRLKSGQPLSDIDVFNYISDLNDVAEKSPQLINMIMRTSYTDNQAAQKRQGFKDFQNLLFGSFLQTKDDKTYAGQQGFYRTILMGLGNSTLDKATADLMFDLEDEGSLRNLEAYARFKPLEYNPLTNIHDVLYRSIASKSTSMTKNDSNLDSILLESEARDLGDAANLRLMSSIGIGNTLQRDDYIVRNEQGDAELGKDSKVIFDAMQRALQASSADLTALNKARETYLSSMQKEFGDLNSNETKDTVRLSFYTGSHKKLSQLPQRIKNAMGSRPMYQYSIDAQMALERGESLTDLSDNYLQQYRQPLVDAAKLKVTRLLQEREQLVRSYGENSQAVKNIDSQIDDLKVIGAKAFNSKVAGLGAVFSGRIKSVLNQEQISFITKTKERLQNSIGDLIAQGELSEDVLDELVRVEIMKAGLTNRGLGKMIAGSNHINYGIALIQLSGTYNDTFSANPLYGTTYHSRDAYQNIRDNNIDIYNPNLSALDRDKLGVYNLGMKEGHYETRQRSVKGSKMGPGGMELTTQENDIVVQDKETGSFVHKRKVNGKWEIVRQVDEKRNMVTVRNLVDSNGLSPVSTPALGSKTDTIYGREGQNSNNYIYSVDSREGNFANNEYLVTYGTLNSQDPSSGQRVEGTDSSSLVKGVAMFAGRIKYNSIADRKIQDREMNLFENIEDQLIRSYEQGELGGSLKSYLDYRDETQRVKLQDGREGFSALSSSIHGLYNVNNFKSFFWSHGATMLRAQNDAKEMFMLDNLFNNDAAGTNAKKLAASLLLNFGTKFVQESEGSSITNLKRSLVGRLMTGDFGSHYQKLVLGHSQELSKQLEVVFNDDKKRLGRSKGEILQDLIFDKIGGQSGFSNIQLGALNVLTSFQLQKALEGDADASKQLLDLVRQGIIDPVSNRAVSVGGINFTNHADRQAALITTAVDFMHQVSSKGSKLKIASDIDFDNKKMQQVLLNVIGKGHETSDELTEDIMNFLSGVNSDITAVSVFTDITFAYGKDPTGTQSIGKHEAQHLITPFLGDIKKYQESGNLSNLQNTVADLAALVSKTNSGLVFYDQMAKVGFGEKQAINLIEESSDYLFSSFNKQNYLGFYQRGVSTATVGDYAEEYKRINKDLIVGNYDWDSIQTVRDANDSTRFYIGNSEEDVNNNPNYKKVQDYVNKYHSDATETEKARLVDKYLMMGGDKFAMHQLDALTTMMILENDKYQADPDKRMGMDSPAQFLENMSNKQMFFGIPNVAFEMQNGEIVAKPNSNELIHTILPSAKDMQVLGGTYSGFLDPIIKHYQTLSSIFVPGTIENTAFEKIRLSSRDNRAIILSTEEYKALQGVLDSANLMPLELKKGIAGARTQEAFAGKNKYQGFTATGIGNLLMPFGSVVASQTKLDQAGLNSNNARLDAIKESNEKIRQLENQLKESKKGIIFNEELEVLKSQQKDNAVNLRRGILHNEHILSDPRIVNRPATLSQKNNADILRRSVDYQNRLEGDPWVNIKPASRQQLKAAKLLATQTKQNLEDPWSVDKPIISQSPTTNKLVESPLFSIKNLRNQLSNINTIDDLNKFVDQLEVNYEKYSDKNKLHIQTILDQDIPNLFNKLSRGPVEKPIIREKLISFSSIKKSLTNIKTVEELHSLGDYIENNLNRYPKKVQSKLQTILDRGIPNTFNKLSNINLNVSFDSGELFGPFNIAFSSNEPFGPFNIAFSSNEQFGPFNTFNIAFSSNELFGPEYNKQQLVERNKPVIKPKPIVIKSEPILKPIEISKPKPTLKPKVRNSYFTQDDLFGPQNIKPVDDTLTKETDRFLSRTELQEDEIYYLHDKFKGSIKEIETVLKASNAFFNTFPQVEVDGGEVFESDAIRWHDALHGLFNLADTSDLSEFKVSIIEKEFGYEIPLLHEDFHKFENEFNTLERNTKNKIEDFKKRDPKLFEVLEFGYRYNANNQDFSFSISDLLLIAKNERFNKSFDTDNISSALLNPRTDQGFNTWQFDAFLRMAKFSNDKTYETINILNYAKTRPNLPNKYINEIEEVFGKNVKDQFIKLAGIKDEEVFYNIKKSDSDLKGEINNKRFAVDLGKNSILTFKSKTLKDTTYRFTFTELEKNSYSVSSLMHIDGAETSKHTEEYQKEALNILKSLNSFGYNLYLNSNDNEFLKSDTSNFNKTQGDYDYEFYQSQDEKIKQSQLPFYIFDSENLDKSYNFSLKYVLNDESIMLYKNQSDFTVFINDSFDKTENVKNKLAFTKWALKTTKLIGETNVLTASAYDEDGNDSYRAAIFLKSGFERTGTVKQGNQADLPDFSYQKQNQTIDSRYGGTFDSRFNNMNATLEFLSEAVKERGWNTNETLNNTELTGQEKSGALLRNLIYIYQTQEDIPVMGLRSLSRYGNPSVHKNRPDERQNLREWQAHSIEYLFNTLVNSGVGENEVLSRLGHLTYILNSRDKEKQTEFFKMYGFTENIDRNLMYAVDDLTEGNTNQESLYYKGIKNYLNKVTDRKPYSFYKNQLSIGFNYAPPKLKSIVSNVDQFLNKAFLYAEALPAKYIKARENVSNIYQGVKENLKPAVKSIDRFSSDLFKNLSFEVSGLFSEFKKDLKKVNTYLKNNDIYSSVLSLFNEDGYVDSSSLNKSVKKKDIPISNLRTAVLEMPSSADEFTATYAKDKLVPALGYIYTNQTEEESSGYIRRYVKDIYFPINKEGDFPDRKSFSTFIHEFTHIIQDTYGLPVFGSHEELNRLNPIRNTIDLNPTNNKYSNLLEWQAYSLGTFVSTLETKEQRYEFFKEYLQSVSSKDSNEVLEFASKWGFTNQIPNEFKDYIFEDYSPGKAYTFDSTSSQFESIDKTIGNTISNDKLQKQLALNPTLKDREAALKFINEVADLYKEDDTRLNELFEKVKELKDGPDYVVAKEAQYSYLSLFIDKTIHDKFQNKTSYSNNSRFENATESKSDTDSILSFLTEAVNAKGVSITSLDSNAPDDALGAFRPTSNTIEVREGLGFEDRSATLLHELIHIYQVQDNIPLMGRASESEYLDSKVHGSKSSNKPTNMMEWQAHSIEAEYREVLESEGTKNALFYLEDLINNLNNKDTLESDFESRGFIRNAPVLNTDFEGDDDIFYNRKSSSVRNKKLKYFDDFKPNFKNHLNLIEDVAKSVYKNINTFFKYNEYAQNTKAFVYRNFAAGVEASKDNIPRVVNYIKQGISSLFAVSKTKVATKGYIKDIEVTTPVIKTKEVEVSFSYSDKIDNPIDKPIVKSYTELDNLDDARISPSGRYVEIKEPKSKPLPPPPTADWINPKNKPLPVIPTADWINPNITDEQRKINIALLNDEDDEGDNLKLSFDSGEIFGPIQKSLVSSDTKNNLNISFDSGEVFGPIQRTYSSFDSGEMFGPTQRVITSFDSGEMFGPIRKSIENSNVKSNVISEPKNNLKPTTHVENINADAKTVVNSIDFENNSLSFSKTIKDRLVTVNLNVYKKHAELDFSVGEKTGITSDISSEDKKSIVSWLQETTDHLSNLGMDINASPYSSEGFTEEMAELYKGLGFNLIDPEDGPFGDMKRHSKNSSFDYANIVKRFVLDTEESSKFRNSDFSNFTKVQDVDHIGNMISFLTQAVNQKGVRITDLNPNAPKDALGAFKPKSNTIELNSSLDKVDTAATLLHELIHIYQIQNDLPLLGSASQSKYADPNVHGSKSSNPLTNKMEWQAHSIESEFRNILNTKGYDAAQGFLYKITRILKDIDNDYDKNLMLDKDSDLRLAAKELESLGFTSKLNEEQKRSSLNNNNSEDVFYNIKNSNIVTLYSRTPTADWGKQEGWVWASSNITSTKNFGEHVWELKVDLSDSQYKYNRANGVPYKGWGLTPVKNKEWWLSFKGTGIVERNYIGTVDKVPSSPQEKFFHDSYAHSVQNKWEDEYDSPNYWKYEQSNIHKEILDQEQKLKKGDFDLKSYSPFFADINESNKYLNYIEDNLSKLKKFEKTVSKYTKRNQDKSEVGDLSKINDWNLLLLAQNELKPTAENLDLVNKIRINLDQEGSFAGEDIDKIVNQYTKDFRQDIYDLRSFLPSQATTETLGISKITVLAEAHNAFLSDSEEEVFYNRKSNNIDKLRAAEVRLKDLSEKDKSYHSQYIEVKEFLEGYDAYNKDSVIKEYTGGEFFPINREIAQGTSKGAGLTEKFTEASQELERKDRVTYRGGSTEKGSNFSVGQSYVSPVIMSTSLDREVAETFAGQKEEQVLMIIKGKSSFDITNVAYGANESEVLYLPGTTFNVVSKSLEKTESGDDRWIVELEEVEQKNNLTASQKLLSRIEQLEKSTKPSVQIEPNSSFNASKKIKPVDSFERSEKIINKDSEVPMTFDNKYIKGFYRKEIANDFVKREFSLQGIQKKIVKRVSDSATEVDGAYHYYTESILPSSLSDEDLITMFKSKQAQLDSLKNGEHYKPTQGRSDKNTARIMDESGNGIVPHLGTVVGDIGRQKQALSQELRKRGLNPFDSSNQAISTTSSSANLNNPNITYQQERNVTTLNQDSPLNNFFDSGEQFGPLKPEESRMTFKSQEEKDSFMALNKNVLSFYKKQRAAEAFGISNELQKEFNTMKLEAVQVKNDILKFAEVDGLSENDKKAAFETLRDGIKQKRDIAYKMARLDVESGNDIRGSKEYSEKFLSNEDRYIYHAQALNYDALLAEVMLIGNQAALVPLSKEVIKELDAKRKEISQIEFLLNSFEDKDGLKTFIGLGYKSSEVSQNDMFNRAILSGGEGMIGKHMQAIKEIGASFKGLKIPQEAKNAKLQYALQQIESTIQMYKKRSEDMQAFSAERESFAQHRDAEGKLIVDEAVQRKIDHASNEYNNNTRETIQFLEDQKAKLLRGEISDSTLRNVFEDIDVKIAETDRANIYLAEVFRSPTPGGTDPRLHTYRIMQGIQSLNQVSQMLSDTREIGSQPKMIYSTERGQTATVLAALGVTTYGGGDFDGDSYTAIFAQMAPTQKAIQNHQSNVDRYTVVINDMERKKIELESKLTEAAKGYDDDGNGGSEKRIEFYEGQIDQIEEAIEQQKQLLASDTQELAEARRTLEAQIKNGHSNFSARARKQVANYLGIDEAFFVKQGEVMFDAYGNPMVDSERKEKTGINTNKTYDADSLFVFLEQGYKLMEGVESSGGRIIQMMNNVDVLLGHQGTPEAFNNGKFLDDLVKGIDRVEGKISDESPAIGMLKDRVARLQNNIDNLNAEQRQFVNSLKDAPLEQYKAYLEQFTNLNKEMESAAALHNLENAQKAEEAKKDFSKRAFINQWIGGNLYSAITSDSILAKFMTQGNGMTLTEGTFDMTLKTLGKAGGEVLGKTYNTIIGTTFQDAPVITYGRQMLEDGDLANATRTEFQRQLEGDSEYVAEIKQKLKEEGFDPSGQDFAGRVKQRIQDEALNRFQKYQEMTRAAVLKSEGTQGFMKNIHQLLRDSIKLKDGDGGLIERLTLASEEYDNFSKQIAANDAGENDPVKRSELLEARDKVISGMASKLGPGPGLKAFIDLDYLTNESDRTGLSTNEFEQRFLTEGGLNSNRQMLEEYSYSMTDLSEKEREELRNTNTIEGESKALLKVARNMTAKNLANVVTSFRMNNSAVEGRSTQLQNFAASHKASLATKGVTHSLNNVATLKNRTEDGQIDTEDNAGMYIRSKYGLIEDESQAGNFDANRQHKNALGIHLGVEEAHMYNEDGSVSAAYINSLKKASSKLNISTEEYTLMFDIHHEQAREQVGGLFGEDGEKMKQFTVMNMMRKDIARSMLDGRPPGTNSSKTINENIGSEVLTTMAQLAATGKLDSQGMDIFSGMYKGVMGQLLEATDSVVEYKEKGDPTGEMRTMQFTNMTQQQKSAYMTKLIYQNMIGTENNSESGFNRSTSQEARDWKTFNAGLVASSVLELDENGRLGNEFIDALDKAGANSSTGQQIEMYEAMGEEYLRSSLDNEVQREEILKQYLPSKGELGTKDDAFYREQMSKKVRAQMKHRQEQDSKKYNLSRSRHNLGHGVLQRSSFMNNVNTSAINQLSTDSSANALDLFVPLALTMIGSAISEGSVDKDQLMQLGGATFTAFQYARTGTIDSTNLDPTEHKKRLASAQAVGGIFKFKNALAQHGEENVGMAVAQLAVQETTAIAFNAIATPWLSKQIAEKGLGVKHAPALSSLDMKKYAASQQLAGNLGASLISAVSSTLISGLLMRGVESMSQNLGDTIQSFMPAANAVSQANEAISRRRQQEAAFEDFQAETNEGEGEVRDYMVMTSASFDSSNYSHLADLNEPQDVEPSSDGSLTVDLLN